MGRSKRHDERGGEYRSCNGNTPLLLLPRRFVLHTSALAFFEVPYLLYLAPHPVLLISSVMVRTVNMARDERTVARRVATSLEISEIREISGNKIVVRDFREQNSGQGHQGNVREICGESGRICLFRQNGLY